LSANNLHSFSMTKIVSRKNLYFLFYVHKITSCLFPSTNSFSQWNTNPCTALWYCELHFMHLYSSFQAHKTIKSPSSSKNKILILFISLKYFHLDSSGASSIGLKESYVPGSFTAKQKSRPSIITSTIAASFDNSILQVSLMCCAVL